MKQRRRIYYSAALAMSVCDAAKDLLVDQKHMKTAVIMGEDAAWTKPLDVSPTKIPASSYCNLIRLDERSHR
jgi:hypothetical protein